MHTKRKYGIKYGILMLLLVGVCLLYGGYEARADINGAESQVIGAASSTFYYDGAYYRVKDTYINQLINALDTQYDLDQAQANACIDYIYNNVGAGITSGYMYKVSDEETEDAPADTPDESGTEVAQNTDKPAVVEIDKQATLKTKDEVLKEATALASDMGVNIKLDNGKDGITITDQKGNVIISTREAVKNTGFRLNSLIIFVAVMLVAVVGMTIIAWKGKLLEHNYGDEDAKTGEENI